MATDFFCKSLPKMLNELIYDTSYIRLSVCKLHGCGAKVKAELLLIKRGVMLLWA